MSNLTENRLNTTISATDLTAINTAIATMLAKLPAISLTDDQRAGMKSIDVANKVFAEDAIYQITSNGAGVIPAYVSVTNMQNDLTLYEQVDQIKASLTAVTQRLDDIRQVTGDELYTAALTSYKLFESASAAGVPNAKGGYEALKARFAGQGRRADAEV